MPLTAQQPVINAASTSAGPPPQRGLTLRSFVVCLFAMLIMGMWIEYEHCYVVGGPIAENSPPTSALGVIGLLLLMGAALYRLRPSLKLTVAELVVIYTALLVAAPLMTQGLWGRFFGLITSFPHTQDFKSYESLPSMLWPHGENLVDNGRFTEGERGFTTAGTVGWEAIRWRGRDWRLPVLTNATGAESASLTFTIPRRDRHGREQLVPGEHFLFSCLLRAQQMTLDSAYTVTMQTDEGPWWRPVVVDSRETPRSLTLPTGFERVGKSPLTIPADLQRALSFKITLSGPGTLAVHDLEFMNIQAVEGLYTGVNIVRDGDVARLGPHERNFTLRKPDTLLSLAGLRYLLRGFIPLEQWAQPALAWTLLIGALFLGFFGLNVLMRKQWLEHERFAFPMNILPHALFTEATDARGRPYLPLLRNRWLWLGFGLCFLLVALKGLHFYFPEVPAPIFTQRLADFTTNPLLRLYFGEMTVGITFTALAILLLIPTEILFSLWACYWLFKLTFVAGKVWNLNQYAGYPWQHQQTIGAFIGYALVAAIAGRHHLWAVARHLVGRLHLDDSQEAVSYRTAAGMVLASLLIFIAWGVWTRMGALASLLFFGYMLVCGFTASKIRAEAGMPGGYWMPYFSMSLVGALGGYAVFGPTGMLVAAIASGFMTVSCFLFIAPVQIEMMELGRRFSVRLRDIGGGLALGLLGGLFIGGFVLLCWTYGFGGDNMAYTWPYAQDWYFNGLRFSELAADRAFLSGTLHTTPENQPLNFLANVEAKGIGIGVLITGLFAALRGAFAWFPLHPLGYVLSTTYFSGGGFAAILAWLVRLVVQRVGGVHATRDGLVPFAIGMFFACVASVVLFDIVGMVLRAGGATVTYNQRP
jgi:hypothetical protein